jgi:hypothetical protein
VRTLTFDWLLRLLVCAVGVGLLVGTLSLLSRRAFKIDVSARENALLAAAVVGLLAGFQFTRDYQLAATISLIVVGGSFFLRWIMRLMGKRH